VGWDGLTSVIASGITGGSFTENPPSGNQFFYWVQDQ
jgi:hypothetical protein